MYVHASHVGNTLQDQKEGTSNGLELELRATVRVLGNESASARAADTPTPHQIKA